MARLRASQSRRWPSIMPHGMVTRKEPFGRRAGERDGRVERTRLCPDGAEVLGRLGRLRTPMRVAYEAGPTGLGLAGHWLMPRSTAGSRPHNSDLVPCCGTLA